MATSRPRRPSLGTAPLLPGICLVIIIFWALAAVLMLTGTLINAREIEDTVDVINGEVQPIDKDLDSVKLAGETVKLSGRIDRAAKPLSGQLAQVDAAAKDIDKSAKTILVTAGTINGTVKDINGTAKEINSTVKGINGSVTAINGNVVSINGTVNSIGGNVASISGSVSSIGNRVVTINSRVRSVAAGVGPIDARSGRSINASVGSILRRAPRLSRTVDQIESTDSLGGVAGINRRAQEAIDAGPRGVGAVKADFDTILAGVLSIDQHANSINCAPLINLFPYPAGTSFCNR